MVELVRRTADVSVADGFTPMKISNYLFYPIYLPFR